MEAFLLSTLIVALAEIGDKTQLLALVLAARYRRPLPILLAITVATLANHALAAGFGTLAAAWLGPAWMRWILGLGFLAMAVWILVPDKAEAGPALRNRSAFMASLIAFFLVEMGDKTQIATIALAARFESFFPVLFGTTFGMILANAPVVVLGGMLSARIPLIWVRGLAALLFLAIGLVILLDLGGFLIL